jgi:hypothetical protein
MAAPSNAKAQMTPAQQTQLARQSIWQNAKPILQRVTSKTFTTVAAGGNTMAVNPLQIGFLRRFIIEVTGTITNTTTTGGANITLTRTPNGVDNLISNISFNDFTGNPRHNCSGRSLSYVEAMKYRRIPGAAYTSDSVSGFGSNVASNACPATIAPNAGGTASATVTRVYELPIMQDDGRQMAGGLWLGVNNQSTLLNITLNPTPIAQATGDVLGAIYVGSAGVAAGTLTNVTVNVYQDYWNNVPTDKSGNPILPVNDLQTAYMITETNSGLTFSVGQPSSWNYPTFSKLLGTYLAFNNGATGSADLYPGTDLTQIALVVSNYSIIKQYDPNVLDRITRDIMGTSFPLGQYAISSRMHPLDVSQYPSLQLQLTPSVANAGAYALITTELLRPVQYMATASGVGGT